MKQCYSVTITLNHNLSQAYFNIRFFFADRFAQKGFKVHVSICVPCRHRTML